MTTREAKRRRGLVQERRQIVEETLVTGAPAARAAQERRVNRIGPSAGQAGSPPATGWSGGGSCADAGNNLHDHWAWRGGSDSKPRLQDRTREQAGSDSASERAGSIYSLIGTAKPTGLDPKVYLRNVHTRIADRPINRSEGLLPWDSADHQAASGSLLVIA